LKLSQDAPTAAPSVAPGALTAAAIDSTTAPAVVATSPAPVLTEVQTTAATSAPVPAPSLNGCNGLPQDYLNIRECCFMPEPIQSSSMLEKCRILCANEKDPRCCNFKCTYNETSVFTDKFDKFALNNLYKKWFSDIDKNNVSYLAWNTTVDKSIDDCIRECKLCTLMSQDTFNSAFFKQIHHPLKAPIAFRLISLIFGIALCSKLLSIAKT